MSVDKHPFWSVHVARGGFEPPLTVPKTAVLPLDDRAVKSLTETKITNYMFPSQGKSIIIPFLTTPFYPVR
jgi:hypothetical protein